MSVAYQKRRQKKYYDNNANSFFHRRRHWHRAESKGNRSIARNLKHEKQPSAAWTDSHFERQTLLKYKLLKSERKKRTALDLLLEPRFKGAKAVEPSLHANIYIKFTANNFFLVQVSQSIKRYQTFLPTNILHVAFNNSLLLYHVRII